MVEFTYHPIESREPSEVIARRNYVPEAAEHCAECSCGQMHAPGRIVNSRPYLGRSGSWELTRRLYCDGCHALMLWWEQCDERGKLTGIRLTHPLKVTDQRNIDRFLSENRHAAGVLL